MNLHEFRYFPAYHILPVLPSILNDRLRVDLKSLKSKYVNGKYTNLIWLNGLDFSKIGKNRSVWKVVIFRIPWTIAPQRWPLPDAKGEGRSASDQMCHKPKRFERWLDMTFPDSKFVDTGSYADAYFTKFKDAAATVDRERIGSCREFVQLYCSGN